MSLSLKVLLWDEPFNNEELAMSGVVGTNDEVTRIYFSNTKVSSNHGNHGNHGYYVRYCCCYVNNNAYNVSYNGFYVNYFVRNHGYFVNQQGF